MSHKRVDSRQLLSLLQRGTITLKMYQTTVNLKTFPSVEENPQDLLVQVEDSIFTTFDGFSSHLKHLDLTTAILPTDLLQNLLGSCRALRKLSLESLTLNLPIVK